MNRSDISELYYIAPIANLPTIVQHGILSHRLAGRIAHSSVAMDEIQARRKNKQIPGAGTLHDYANLYFDAHNPMLCKLQDRNDDICVLMVDSKVLELPRVVVTDRNAASDWVRFSTVPDGLKAIDRDRVFAKYWTHPQDPHDEMLHKSEKCAEILVPERVDPGLLIGAWVATEAALAKIRQMQIELQVCVNNAIFF